MPSEKRFPAYYYPLQWLLLGLAYLPLGLLYVLAEGIYLLTYYVIGYRRHVVLTNLRNSFPEKSEGEVQQIAKEFYRHFAEVMVETLKLAHLTPAELRQRVRFTNPEVMEKWFGQGRAVLGLSSHAGNWEWVLPSGAVWLSAPADGVYKPLSNPFFEDFLYRLRTRTGARLIPMRDTLRNLVRHRGQTRVVSMLSDQAAGPEDQPYWTTFLNQEAGFYTSADRLAAQFRLPVIYVSIRRQRRGYYELVLTELYDGDSPLDPARCAITDAFVRHLERDIRQFPADYLWTHRRWKHQR